MLVNNLYRIQYHGKRGVYNISISIRNNEIECGCSCSSKKPCRHIHSILIGRNEKLNASDAVIQNRLIQELENCPEGIDILQRSKIYFQLDSTCRRCNSKNIIDTKSQGMKARLYKLISTHRYYCRDCRWSW